METQRADELSKGARKIYDDEVYSQIIKNDDGTKSVTKKERKHDL